MTDTTLGAFGEEGVLAHILPRLPQGDATLVGPGDDAAVMATSDGRYVVTSDLMVHGPDFRFAWSTAHDLGWKAAATNLADVASMGARPTALVVALAAPAHTELAVLSGIADGLRDGIAAMAPGVGVVGGDLSVSATFTIAVTAFGDLEGRPPVVRSGARPGDIVAHAGLRGAAARGLRLLFEHATAADGRPDAARAAGLRQRHRDLVIAQLAPTPPIAAGVLAAQAGATAMLDVSDGLVRDARRIAEASDVSLVFRKTAIDPAACNPMARRSDDESITFADVLAGAEDHGLLATFPPGASLPPPFVVVGSVGAAAGQVLLDDAVLPAIGWDPYRDWDGRGLG